MAVKKKASPKKATPKAEKASKVTTADKEKPKKKIEKTLKKEAAKTAKPKEKAEKPEKKAATSASSEKKTPKAKEKAVKAPKAEKVRAVKAKKEAPAKTTRKISKVPTESETMGPGTTQAKAAAQRIPDSLPVAPPGGKPYTNSLGIEFVLLSAGIFVRGATQAWTFEHGEQTLEVTWDKPPHLVTLAAPFFLAKHPVTQAQWEAVMGSNPSKSKNPDQPVEMVSWNDAQAFIQALNERENTDRYHYRLPTEAEWEYAARAGSRSEFFWGDDKGQLAEYAWYAENSEGTPQPVGRKRPNSWGLYDMYGNIWEWVQDFYAPYSQESLTDPCCDESLVPERVLRGGSWSDTAADCRSACRNSDAPDMRDPYFGFRLVLSPKR